MRRVLTLSLAFLALTAFGPAPFRAVDPGPRPGVSAGPPVSGLLATDQELFDLGLDQFLEVEDVGAGLGPRFNGTSCAECHAQPAVGGTSPTVNPQVAAATAQGANNTIPAFIRLAGPVREARFVRNPDGSPDGGVHALFTIAGMAGAEGCSLAQPDFAAQLSRNNVIFRIPTPVFGAGLIEQIPDRVILANQSANGFFKRALGISGHPNRNGNDGTITRFGWKAQNKSLLTFAGEAYNVEMGVTNELFPQERDETPSCNFVSTPNDITAGEEGVHSNTTVFASFMRFLDAPQPAPATVSTQRGRLAFVTTGCALCHTPQLTTGVSTIEALSEKPVNLFSDLLVHDMGEGLKDGVSQGLASGREFRSAPLWGVGQRLFFLHDGRTADLVQAIKAHASVGSEANSVTNNFNNLPEGIKQDLLNFLRSL